MTTKKVYFISLGAILLASVYPIYMGVTMCFAYIRDGGIDITDYPKYIIPYTPICISLILCTVMLPLIYKLFKKFILPVLSGLGVALFLISEVIFENIVVFVEKTESIPVDGWQWFLCRAPLPNEILTEEISTYITETLGMQYNSLFKIHFYAISLLIVVAVIGVIYGFYNMAETRNFTKRKPLIVQLVSVFSFICLCVLACFTTFFRTGDINISPISAVLMTIFFLIFGITAGVYTGTWFYGKLKVISIVIPSIVATLMTVVMYIGEMVMLDWELFRFGNGFLFESLGFIPLSLFDILTILLSGAITFIILTVIRSKNDKLTS